MIARGKCVAQKPDEADPGGRCKGRLLPRNGKLNAGDSDQHNAERNDKPEYDPRLHTQGLAL